jgi:membrane-bound lytic murein transglycosylase B
MAAPARLDLPKDRIRRLQRTLTALGFDTHGADGVLGKKTKLALSQYQASRGLARTDYFDDATVQRLDGEIQ